MIEYQSFLARLYTDDVFRLLNRIDPAAAQSFFDLDDEHKAALGSLDLDAIEDFARGLAARSRDRLESLFPVTRAAIGAARFEAVFARFHSLHRNSPGEAKAVLAGRFGLFIEDVLRTDTRVPPWHAELARFERAVLEASIRGEHAPPRPASAAAGPADAFVGACRLVDGVEVNRFDHDVVALLERVKAGVAGPPPPPCVTHVVTAPRPGSRQPRVLKVPARAADLLESLRWNAAAQRPDSPLGIAALSGLPRAELEAALRQFAGIGLVTT